MLRPGILCVPCVLCVLLLSCASAGDPPGGPEDTAAPVITAVEPDSGAVLAEVPREATVSFDEVVNERVAGTPPDIASSVLLSPTVGATRVRWRRNRITVQPREGFRPGIVYRLEILPVFTDLRQNRLRAGRTVVFSTGPEIPAGRLSGALVNWTAGQPVPRGLVEAVLLGDSLPYRTLTDSTGYFEMSQLPRGDYLVYGIVDANSDRRLGQREAFDTVRVSLDTATVAQLYAFAHDTVGPRLREAELADSVTIRLTFDRPLDPSVPLDTSAVHLAPVEDSTARVGVAAVFTRAEVDSMRAREERQRRPGDSARVDTARADTTRPARAQPAPRPARPAQQPQPRQQQPRAPLDSTLAQRMIARRPSPSDVRMVRLAAPLPEGSRWYVIVEGARGLTGVTGASRQQVRRPEARRR